MVTIADLRQGLLVLYGESISTSMPHYINKQCTNKILFSPHDGKLEYQPRFNTTPPLTSS